MQITPIQKTSFTSYNPKDAHKLKDYTLKYKQGALCDLYKKFDFALVDTFKKTKRIETPNNTHNWKLGERAEKILTHSVHSARPKGGYYSKVGH